PPSTLEEFPGPIPEALRSRLQWLTIEEVVEIASERLNRRVPALRLLVHRRQAQDVEIRPRRGAGWKASVHQGRARRVPLGNHCLDFGGRPVRQVVGTAVGEQLI